MTIIELHQIAPIQEMIEVFPVSVTSGILIYCNSDYSFPKQLIVNIRRAGWFSGKI